MELWSLLNFMMPKIFSERDDFESWFNFDSSYKQGKGRQRKKKKESSDDSADYCPDSESSSEEPEIIQHEKPKQ